MATLTLETADGRTEFRPGEEVAGVASWQLDRPPRAVEVRLFWYTEGKGTRDVAIADSVRFEGPPETDRQEFRLKLGEGPFSFSGRLISLLWALELLVEPGSEATRLGLTVSPTGREVLLYPDAGAP